MQIRGSSPIAFRAVGGPSRQLAVSPQRLPEAGMSPGRQQASVFPLSPTRLAAPGLHRVYFGNRTKGANPIKLPPQQTSYLADSYHVGDFILGMPTGDPHRKTLNDWRTFVWDVATRPRPAVDGQMRPWLDPLPTNFYVVNKHQLYDAAAHDGFPARYPHWSFGQQYYHMEQQQDHGMSKLYELVINNNPSTAYLLDTNRVHEQAVVMAHVFGHTDFFKNNIMFEKTDRHMADTMGLHRARVLNYMDQNKPVEDFIDKAHAIRWLIDFSSMKTPSLDALEDSSQVMAEQALSHETFLSQNKLPDGIHALPMQGFPSRPTRDVLGFLLRYGRGMDSWQRDILSMVRKESYYFAPQLKTKMMNEGWATFWHEKLMKDVVEVMKPPRPLESLELADLHPMMEGVKHPSRTSINPYRLGSLIFKEIEAKANEEARKKGIVIDEDGMTPGIQKARQVMMMEDDEGFIQNYLSDELIRKEKLYSWVPGYRNLPTIESVDPKVVREVIAKEGNKSFPEMEVAGLDTYNWELRLRHLHQWDLKQDWAKWTLRHMSEMFGGVMHLDTILTDDKDPSKKTPIRYSTQMAKTAIEGKQVAYISTDVRTFELDKENGVPIYEITSNGGRVKVDEQGRRTT